MERLGLYKERGLDAVMRGVEKSASRVVAVKRAISKPAERTVNAIKRVCLVVFSRKDEIEPGWLYRYKGLFLKEAMAGKSNLQAIVWQLHIPITIKHPGSVNPYVKAMPRLASLAMIAPYAQAFVDRPCVQFTYDGIPINPHMSLGLIKDLYARDEDSLYIRVVKPDHEMPDRADWLLQVSKDTWKNSSKEADYIRYGHARGFMGMSVEDEQQLINAVMDFDSHAWKPVFAKLVSQNKEMKNIPARIYIPEPPEETDVDTSFGDRESSGDSRFRVHSVRHGNRALAQYKAVQDLIPARTARNKKNTLGAALYKILPTLFPSPDGSKYCKVILHGKRLPWDSELEDLAREACYPDGWLYMVVVMNDDDERSDTVLKITHAEIRRDVEKKQRQEAYVQRVEAAAASHAVEARQIRESASARPSVGARTATPTGGSLRQRRTDELARSQQLQSQQYASSSGSPGAPALPTFPWEGPSNQNANVRRQPSTRESGSGSGNGRGSRGGPTDGA